MEGVSKMCSHNPEFCLTFFWKKYGSVQTKTSPSQNTEFKTFARPRQVRVKTPRRLEQVRVKTTMRQRQVNVKIPKRQTEWYPSQNTSQSKQVQVKTATRPRPKMRETTQLNTETGLK